MLPGGNKNKYTDNLLNEIEILNKNIDKLHANLSHQFRGDQPIDVENNRVEFNKIDVEFIRLVNEIQSEKMSKQNRSDVKSLMTEKLIAVENKIFAIVDDATLSEFFNYQASTVKSMSEEVKKSLDKLRTLSQLPYPTKDQLERMTALQKVIGSNLAQLKSSTLTPTEQLQVTAMNQSFANYLSQQQFNSLANELIQDAKILGEFLESGPLKVEKIQQYEEIKKRMELNIEKIDNMPLSTIQKAKFDNAKDKWVEAINVFNTYLTHANVINDEKKPKPKDAQELFKIKKTKNLLMTMAIILAPVPTVTYMTYKANSSGLFGNVKAKLKKTIITNKPTKKR